ncbi:hypothetical protein VC87395_001508 [Vibrio paracholerae 87395]|nr:hypothetical protein VC87395_001508 [Vibrio paracholerae 87395]
MWKTNKFKIKTNGYHKNPSEIKLSIYSRLIRSNINSRSINTLIHNFGG